MQKSKISLTYMVGYLVSTGMSPGDIAKVAGCDRSTIYRVGSQEGIRVRSHVHDGIVRAYIARRKEVKVLEDALRELEE